MHLLKGAVTAFLAAISLASCAPRNALTPQDAFSDLNRAFRAADAAALERQLSRGSVDRIRKITKLFAAMEERQLEALSRSYDMPAGRLKRLTVRDYCGIIIRMDREGNVIGKAAARKIVGVNRDGNRATVRADNGMELTFVKEGPYWLFDMTEL